MIVEDTVQKTQLLQSLGVNVNLAPVADVSIDPGDFSVAEDLWTGCAGHSGVCKDLCENLQPAANGLCVKALSRLWE